MLPMHSRSRIYAALRRSVCTLAQSSHSERRAIQRLLPVLRERRFIQTSRRIDEGTKEKSAKERTRALAVYAFDDVRRKEKETFLDVLHMYEDSEPLRKGHVDFVNAAMKYMDEFGVNEDLEIYKKLINVLPKGRFIAGSPLSADFMHYPRQQQCIIDLLEKMETNGVIPDVEVEQMLLNIFGQFGIPLRKFWRMMYWMPKFRNLNPWPTPRPVPNDALILAKLAIEKIASVDVQSDVTVFESETVPDSIDKTWIVSASSPEQRGLIEKHPEGVAVYVEGPHKIWVAHMAVDYFILRADARGPIEYDDIDEDDVSNIDVAFFDVPKSAVGMIRSVHEQEDATILSVCATGTSSKDSLLSWIRCLQKRSPKLEKIPVLFKLTRHIGVRPEIEPGEAGEEGKVLPNTVHKISEN